ncbi:MAG: peptide ABC transporter substrate-binding protein [Rhodospirillaceae bacterium]|nr:peptide ABC transporter substrate-binding protein [Rhodospirillaceae bacterium]|tara:strand:- start:3002 stop:4531 length:1530 start_codon:yes stop_codon:yes gene_type:complete
MIKFRFWRSFVTAAGATLLVASLAFTAHAKNKTRVTVGVTETVGAYNPHSDSVALMYAVWCQVYGCLGSWDFTQAKDVGVLAESWSIPDPNTWIFKLRKGIKRHDGKAELTAADVVHSIKRIGTDKRSSQRQNVKKIKSVTALDKYTVKIVTKKPTAPLLGYVFDRVMITSKDLYEKHGARKADRKYHYGYGPYMLKRLRTGESVVIEKNPHWPGVKKEWPDEVIFRIMREPEQRVTALLNGEIQIAQFIPPHLLSKVRKSKNARIEEMGSVELMMLLMNPAFKPWDNELLRKAVAYAIDRKSIIKNVLKGEAIKLTGPIGPLQFGYSKNVKPTYEYNPKKARELVKKAGYPNGIDVELYTPVGRYVNDKQVTQAMIPMLKAVGIRAKLKTPEWSTLWSNVRKGKVPFFYMGRGGMVDPSAALSQYFETGIAPRIKFSSKKVDSLLQKERETFDLTMRKKYMNQAINALMEEVPAHFLWHQKIHYGVANGVHIAIRPDKRIHGYEMTIK